FSAWPANAMGLRALQKYIYDALINKTDHVLKMGALITISQSAHIYDDCFENVANVISSQYSKIAQRKDYFDPAGSFIITIQNNQIIVEHTTPGSGEIVNCYSGKSAHKISQHIFTDCPGLQISNAMYLGVELQKAETALLMKEQLIYEQDKPLKKNTILKQ
ncbi:MAG: thymidylate synthase, partial [Dolichospermum sp.]